MKVGPRQSWSVFGDLYFWPGRPVRSAITVGAGADGASGAVFRDTGFGPCMILYMIIQLQLQLQIIEPVHLLPEVKC